MRTFKKNGLIRSLTSVLAVVLLAALVLTGCSDKTAQTTADEAKAAAAAAQTSADNANTAASKAQQKADEAEAAAKANAEAIAKLLDESATTEVVKKILNDYVKGDNLPAENSIITSEEIKDFLTSDELATKVAKMLTGYATLTQLGDYAKKTDVAALQKALTDAQTALNTTLATFLTKAAAESDYVKKAALADYSTTAQMTRAIADAIAAAKAELTTQLGAMITEIGNKANAADLEALKNSLSDYCKISAFEAKVSALSADIALRTTAADVAALIAAELANYYDKTKVDLIKTDLETKIAACISATDVDNAINAKIADYYTKLEIDALLDSAGIVNEYLKVNGYVDTDSKPDFGKLVDALKAYSDAVVGAHEKDFADATPVVVDKINAVNKLLADYAAKKNNYTAADYTNLVAAFENAKIYLIRAQSISEAETIFDDVVDDAKAIPTHSDRTYEALQAIAQPIVIEALVAGYTDAYIVDSNADIANAEAKLAAAKAALTATEYTDYVNNYKLADGTVVDLEAKIVALRAVYTNLENAKTDAKNNVQPIIDLIRADYLTVTKDQTAEVAALHTEVANATAAIAKWKTDWTLADTDVNIPRLLDKVTTYDGALAHDTTLQGLDQDIADFITEIVTLLSADKYIDNTVTPYTINGTCLYSTLDGLNELIAKINTWADKYSIPKTELGNLIKSATNTEYTDLVAAGAYAQAMTDKKIAADVETTGLIARIDAAIAAIRKLDNAAAIQDIKAEIEAWINTGVVVDDENRDAILGATRLADYKAAYDRIEALKAALVEAKAINVKIEAFGLNGEFVTINDMKKIKALIDERDAWAVKNAIPAPGSTDYVEENYNMVNNALLYVENPADPENPTDIYHICYNIIKAAIIDARANVLPLIAKIDMTGKILYQEEEISAAWNAFTQWSIRWKVSVIDLGILDLADLDAGDLMKTQFLSMNDAHTKLNKEKAEAQALYAADKIAYYDAFDALAGAYTVKNGRIINEAFAAAKAWFNRFADADKGGIAKLNTLIANLMPAAEYDAIVAADEAYELTLASAIADGKAIADLYDAIMNITVYSNAKIQAAKTAYEKWLATYGVDYTTDFTAPTNMDAKLLAGGEIDMKLLGDKIYKAEADYTALVNQAKIDAAPVNATISAMTVANVNIYSRNDIETLRASYNAWANKYLAGVDEAAYTDEIADDYLRETMKGVLEHLIDLEEELAKLEAEKKAETEAVIALIKVLEGKTITTDDKAAIDAARSAYNDWLSGKFDHVTVDGKYAIVAGKTEYVIDDAVLKILTDAEAAYAAIKVKLDAAQAAIDALKAKKIPTDDTQAAEYQTLIDDAKTKLQEFIDANGGEVRANTISDEDIAYITTAEFNIKRYNAYKNLAAVYNQYCADNGAKANYVLVLKPKFDTAYTDFQSSVAVVTPENFNANEKVYESIVSQFDDALRIIVAENP